MTTVSNSLSVSALYREGNVYANLEALFSNKYKQLEDNINGRGDTVSLSYDEYKSMKSRIELLELLAEADEDVAYERVSPIQDTFNDLRAMLKGK